MTYNEFKFWSPLLGADAARLSMADEAGSEYWMIVPNNGGKAYRDKKLSALDAISTAIQIGLEPGRVTIQ